MCAYSYWVSVRAYQSSSPRISNHSGEDLSTLRRACLCIASIIISQYLTNYFSEKVYLQIHKGVRYFFRCIIKLLCVELIVQKQEPTNSMFKGGMDLIEYRSKLLCFEAIGWKTDPTALLI